jgi:hypothetical protein
MNTDRELCRAILVQQLGELVDPKYHPHPERYEKQLREALRVAAKTNPRFLEPENLPPFVIPYVAKWTAEKAAA